MKQLVSILGFLTFMWSSTAANAQLYPPNEAGVTLAAWHTIVRDVEATKKFWLVFGGEPTKIDGVDVIKLPGVLVFLHPGEPTGPSTGAVVDHVGISCQYCFYLIRRLTEAGYKTDKINPTTMRSVNWKPDGEPTRAWSYAYTPDGIRLEIETNPCTNGAVYATFAPRDPIVPCAEKMPGFVTKNDPAGAIGSDQLHFFLNSDPDITQMHKFYKGMLGARSIRYSNLNLVIPGFIGLTVVSETGKRPSNKGRALDSIGLEVKNLEAFTKKLEADGVKFDEPYSKTRYKSYAHAAFTDRWGVPFQLTEGLAKIASPTPPPPSHLSAAEERGKQVFEVYCSYCHSITSTDVQYADAPGLLGEFRKPPHKLWKTGKGPDSGPGQGRELVVTEQSVRQIIMLGTDEFEGRMPATGAGLSAQQVDDVIAYVKTL